MKTKTLTLKLSMLFSFTTITLYGKGDLNSTNITFNKLETNLNETSSSENLKTETQETKLTPKEAKEKLKTLKTLMKKQVELTIKTAKPAFEKFYKENYNYEEQKEISINEYNSILMKVKNLVENKEINNQNQEELKKMLLNLSDPENIENFESIITTIIEKRGTKDQEKEYKERSPNNLLESITALYNFYYISKKMPDLSAKGQVNNNYKYIKKLGEIEKNISEENLKSKEQVLLPQLFIKIKKQSYEVILKTIKFELAFFLEKNKTIIKSKNFKLNEKKIETIMEKLLNKKDEKGDNEDVLYFASNIIAYIKNKNKKTNSSFEEYSNFIKLLKNTIEIIDNQRIFSVGLIDKESKELKNQLGIKKLTKIKDQSLEDDQKIMKEISENYEKEIKELEEKINKKNP